MEHRLDTMGQLAIKQSEDTQTVRKDHTLTTAAASVEVAGMVGIVILKLFSQEVSDCWQGVVYG